MLVRQTNFIYIAFDFKTHNIGLWKLLWMKCGGPSQNIQPDIYVANDDDEE